MISHDALEAARKSGKLELVRAELDPDQMPVRTLWISTAVWDQLLNADLGPQRSIVKAALKRFIVGGQMLIITDEVDHYSVDDKGDIRELKVSGPNFVEFRFKPPKHHLRLFGSFLAQDVLLISGIGMKDLSGKVPSQKPLSVEEQRKRAKAFFELCGLDRRDALPTHSEYMTNVLYQFA